MRTDKELLELKEYFYGGLEGVYSEKELEELRKIYLKHTYYKENEDDLENILKSVYPPQHNDYFLLQLDDKFIPIDAEYINIVLYLNKNGIETYGVDISYNFISFCLLKNDDTSSIKFLKKKIKEIEVKSSSEMEKIKKINKLYIEEDHLFASLIIPESKYKWLHKKLKLKIPDIKESFPGLKTCMGDKNFNFLEYMKEQ